MGSPAATPFRQRVRAQLREEILDAAYSVTVQDGWQHVTMTTLAHRVGISRQTLYKEFGSKHEVGHALVLREAEWFQQGVLEQAAQHTELATSLYSAVAFALTHGTSNPLVRSIIASAETGAESLLPFITTPSGRVLDTAFEVFRDYLQTHHPHIPPDDIDTIADITIRLTISNVLRPAAPTTTTAQRITHLVAAYLDSPQL